MIRCQGFDLTSLSIPNFCVGIGCIGRLQMPKCDGLHHLQIGHDFHAMCQILTGQRRHPHVSIEAKSTEMVNVLSNEETTVGDWLQRYQLRNDLSKLILERLSLKVDTSTGILPGTTRALLGLEIAFQLSSLVVVHFVLDPLGLIKARSHLGAFGTEHATIEVLGARGNSLDAYKGSDVINIAIKDETKCL